MQMRNAPALSHLILSTARLAKVAYRRQLCVHRRVIKPSFVKIFDCLCRIFLASEFHIHIADHMLAKIVTHIHLLNLAVLVLEFTKDLLKEIIEMRLLLGIDLNVSVLLVSKNMLHVLPDPPSSPRRR